MSASKTRAKQRKKHCPVCKTEVSMSVMREAEDKDDLCWLLCNSCNNKFALTRSEYQKEKQPDISATTKDNAKVYSTDRNYKVGELIYHSRWADLGWVINKVAAPISDCSGAIIVSFMKVGLKTLIEGYKAT